MSEPTEVKIVKEKKPRSEAQLAILAEARIKAGKVRAENASIRKQEKDMAKEIKEQEKADRVAKLKAHQEKKKGKSPLGKEELKPETDFVEDSSSSGEEEIVVMKKPLPKPKKKKKKKVRIVYESDSSQEEAPQRTQRIVSDTPPPQPIKTKQQLAYDCLRSQMFHGQ
tara:strand:+ start:1112 stop:1615 length:504 start_codon:yes stop_codon:yes gene_type:complete